MSEKKPSQTLVAKLSVILLKEGKAENKTNTVTFKLLEGISTTEPDGTYPPKPEIYADKKVWEISDFADDLAGEATFDKVWKDDKEFYFTLLKWNGKEKEAYDPNKPKQGKGQSYTPKSKAEIHSPSVCGVIKSGYESAAILGIKGADLEPHLKVGLQAYCDTIAMLEKQ